MKEYGRFINKIDKKAGGLPVRLYNKMLTILIKYEIENFEQLQKLTDDQLLNVRFLGPARLDDFNKYIRPIKKL